MCQVKFFPLANDNNLKNMSGDGMAPATGNPIADYLTYCATPVALHPEGQVLARPHRAKDFMKRGRATVEQARAAAKRGDTQEARRKYEAAIGLYLLGLCNGPYGYTIYSEMGSAYRELGVLMNQPDVVCQAIQTHQLALDAFQHQHGFSNDIRAQQDKAAILANYATTLLMSGNFEMADKVFQDAIRAARSGGFQKEQGKIFANYSSVLVELGKYAEALKMTEEALRYDLRDGIAYFNQGLAHSKLGQKELALADFENAKRYGNFTQPEIDKAIANLDLPVEKRNPNPRVPCGYLR